MYENVLDYHAYRDFNLDVFHDMNNDELLKLANDVVSHANGKR